MRKYLLHSAKKWTGRVVSSAWVTGVRVTSYKVQVTGGGRLQVTGCRVSRVYCFDLMPCNLCPVTSSPLSTYHFLLPPHQSFCIFNTFKYPCINGINLFFFAAVKTNFLSFGAACFIRIKILHPPVHQFFGLGKFL